MKKGSVMRKKLMKKIKILKRNKNIGHLKLNEKTTQRE